MNVDTTSRRNPLAFVEAEVEDLKAKHLYRPLRVMSAAQAKVMAEAIDILRKQGAIVVDPADIPSVVDKDRENNLLAWSVCSSMDEVKTKRCSIDLAYGMERDFNNRAGFTRADDALPKRLVTEPAKSGPAKGMVNQLDKMLPEYYDLRGWDQNGQLKPETRARLGLQ